MVKAYTREARRLDDAPGMAGGSCGLFRGKRLLVPKIRILAKKHLLARADEVIE